MRVLTYLLLITFAPVVMGQAIEGRVVGVSDGDTLTLLTAERQQVKVRLAEIDTPEKRQPWGTRAKEALSKLVYGKAVRVEAQTVDRYGRTVGRVYQEELDVNAEMVRQGHAWAYRQYLRDHRILDLEDEARVAGRGLWGLAEAQRTPPWEWRAVQRTGGISTEPRKAVGACGSKRYCSEMSSCDEARFYLERCGLSRLDRDGDGQPCESLCR